jgi:hypothetical protein
MRRLFAEEKVVSTRGTGSALWTWIIRIVIALAILAAPIITFKAFTDSDAPDPVREQRLREARDGSHQNTQTTSDSRNELSP